MAGGAWRVGAAGVDKEDEVNGIYDLEEEAAYYEKENAELRAELSRRDEKIADLRNVYGDCKDAIARRDETIARLKEDAERLASYCQHKPVENGTCWVNLAGGVYCKCGLSDVFTLHHALMKELE